MNKWVGIGRLTADPDIRYTQGENSTAVARYSIAIDRRRANPDGTREADFIRCVAFGKAAEFADKYLHKGMKIAVSGRIQTCSYTDKDGKKVYTTDIVIEDQEFVESKKAEGNSSGSTGGSSGYNEGFEPTTDEEFDAMFSQPLN